jgi:hypothetical protein
MRKIALFLMATVLIMVIISCKKDEEVDQTIKIGLVTKIFKGSTINREIQYDASNLPIKMGFYGSTGYPDGYSSYIYNSDSLIEKISIYNQQHILTSYTTYMYDTANRLINKKYFSGNSNPSHTETFLYNSKSQLINLSDFDSSGNVSFYLTQTFDTLDNPTEVKYYKSDNTYAGSIYYTYDNKPNVFAKYYQKLGISHPYNKHNITKVTSSLTPVNGIVTISLGNTTITISLYSSSYDYDFNNLPKKENRNYLNGKGESESYEYK